MSDRVRTFVFLAAAGGLGLILLGSLRGLPTFGRPLGTYGDLVNATAVPERHATNAVTTVNFDIRALDTLGEEFILFAAVAGVSLLLRERRGESEQAQPGGQADRVLYWRSEAVQWSGPLMIGVTVLFGLYIVLHAHLTPGGGFQGGAVLGTCALLVYLTAGYKAYRRLAPKPWLDLGEALGAGGYVLIGLACLLAGGAFLENVLPLGKTGALLSAGTIPLINLSVGLEVAAGFSLLFSEFLEETRTEEPGEKR